MVSDSQQPEGDTLLTSLRHLLILNWLGTMYSFDWLPMLMIQVDRASTCVCCIIANIMDLFISNAIFWWMIVYKHFEQGNWIESFQPFGLEVHIVYLLIQSLSMSRLICNVESIKGSIQRVAIDDLENILVVVLTIISTSQPRTLIELACHCIFSNSAHEQEFWTGFAICCASMLMGAVNLFFSLWAYPGQIQFIPTTGKRARILRGSSRQAQQKADVLISVNLKHFVTALSKENIVACLVNLMNSGFHGLTAAVLLLCSKQNTGMLWRAWTEFHM